MLPKQVRQGWANRPVSISEDSVVRRSIKGPRHHNQPWGGFDSGGQPELQSRASSTEPRFV